MCNDNFATGEGRPECGDPPGCEWAQEGFRHAETARKVFGDAGRPAPPGRLTA